MDRPHHGESDIRKAQRALSSDPSSPDRHARLADALYRSGDLEGAREAYHAALRLAPESAALYNGLGSVLCDIGKLEEGIAAFNKALVNAGDERAETRVNLELAQGEGTLIEKRISAIEQAAAGKDASAADRVALGCARLLRGDFSHAVSIMRAVLKHDADDLPAARVLGFIYTLPNYTPGSPRRALKDLNEGVRRHPQDARLRLSLGEILAGIGEEDSAAEHYCRSIELDPAALEACDLAAGLNAGCGVKPFTERVDRMMADASREAAGKPEDAAAQRRLALANLAAARLRQPRERALFLATARSILSSLAERHPDDVDTSLLLIDCLTGQGERTEAARLAERTAKAHPAHWRARFENAGALLRQGRMAEAIPEFLEATRIDPLEAPAYLALRFAFEAHRRARLEEARCARAVARGDKTAAPHFALGQALRAGFRLAEAAEAFQKAMDAQPQLIEARVALGQTKVQMGDVAGAEECLRHAIRINPAHPAPHRALGGLLITFMGRTDEGAQELETFRRLAAAQREKA
jgi:Tfp pilus assembly protein PilF